MANETTMAGARPGTETFWRGDAAKALAAALLFGMVTAIGGFRTLDGTADNDSLLRLVEVRDLIAGQGWFDLHQYRMGMEGALPMHWSRLVDAPIAAIVVLATALTGSQAAGETVALIAWPLILYAAALYLLLRIGRLVAGEEAMFPLAILAAATLYFIGVFNPGTLDHHNLQLVLMLAMLMFLLRSAGDRRAGFFAGALAVLMLAVGMETVPYVALGGLLVAGWFLLSGEAARGAAVGFGIAFAATSAIVFLGTVPMAEWGAAYCDAYSVVQFAMGALAGTGLAAITLSRTLSRSLARRAASLATLGGVLALVAAVYFPQCLGDPYADLAPMLRSHWLDAIGEAQPLWSMLASEPEAVAGHHATVLIALAVLGLGMRRNGFRREDVFVAAMLTVALLVTIWQVRGSRFSLPLACVPLAMWIGDIRGRTQAAPGVAASLKLAGAWLVSFHVTWILASLGVWYLLASPEAAEELAKDPCLKSADYGQLAAMPATTVLVVSNLGAPVLRHTPHSVLAGPYHRNVEGNLAALEAFTGPPEEARDVAGANGITLLAFCRGNRETAFLAGLAPAGLLAGLLAGDVPDWLQILPESAGKPLELYRVLSAKD